ncbi:putative integral membrane protein [Acanthocheilonema viteae]
MDRWSTGTACAISISFSLTVIALAVLDTVTGHSQQIFLKKGKEATVNQSTKCGMYGQNLFCLSMDLCNKFCSRQCSKISSFELRNLQILSPEERQIQMLHNDIPLDTNLRINYYDVEMEGMKPAFCGDYFALEMPIYSIKESKSNDIQFLHKLYFQNYRDVYTHSMCNQECVFGCRQVGYDKQIVTELLIRNIPNLHVYQCDSVHSWVFIAVVIVAFIILLILITCFTRSKISNIRGITEEINLSR